MQQKNIPIGTLVDMYKRGEMRLPEIQRHYVWRATRVRDLYLTARMNAFIREKAGL